MRDVPDAPATLYQGQLPQAMGSQMELNTAGPERTLVHRELEEETRQSLP
jgi:hypothetical protein